MPETVICDLLRRRIVGRKGIFRFQLVDRTDRLLRSDIVQRNVLCGRRDFYDRCRRIRDLCELRRDRHVMSRHFERIIAVCNARRHIRTIYRQRIQKIPCCRRDRQNDRFRGGNICRVDVRRNSSVIGCVDCENIVLTDVNIAVPIVVPSVSEVDRNCSGRCVGCDPVVSVPVTCAVHPAVVSDLPVDDMRDLEFLADRNGCLDPILGCIARILRKLVFRIDIIDRPSVQTDQIISILQIRTVRLRIVVDRFESRRIAESLFRRFPDLCRIRLNAFRKRGKHQTERHYEGKQKCKQSLCLHTCFSFCL